MDNKLSIGMSLIIFAMMSACAPVYVPTAKHTHFLDSEDEADIAVYTGLNGFDAQGAYALTPKLGVVGGISASNREGSSSSSDHQHIAIEVGAEYFKKLGKNGRFEALAGLGFGTSEAKEHYDFYGPQKVNAKGSFSNYFLQSNIGLETRAFDLGLAVRMNQIVFSKFETSSTTYNNTKAGTFFEPSIFARLGWEKLKVETQIGFSVPLQQDLEFQYEPLTFSLGIRYNWNLGK